MHARSAALRNSILAGLMGLGLLLPSNVHAADLVVGAFGGVWEQSIRKCVVDPWQKATGKTVDIVLGSPTTWLNQIAAAPGKPPLDVFYNASELVYDAIARGVVAPLTVATVPNIAKLSPEFAAMNQGYGVVHNYGAMGIIRNATTVANPPKNWREFVDGTIAGKWKAAMPNINYPSAGFTVSVWWFAKLAGGDVNNIEPGLADVKKMLASGNLTFWTDPNGVLNGLKSGDIDMALYWDGRAWSFIDDGNKEFKYSSPEPGVIVAMTWIQKAKGASELSDSYINMSLSAEAQACFGNAIRYGIANKDAKFSPAIEPEITPIKILVIPPYKEISTLQAKWIEAWNKEIGR